MTSRDGGGRARRRARRSSRSWSRSRKTLIVAREVGRDPLRVARPPLRLPAGRARRGRAPRRRRAAVADARPAARGKDGPEPEACSRTRSSTPSCASGSPSSRPTRSPTAASRRGSRSASSRSARRCACPLWNRDRVIGALHVDTPLKIGDLHRRRPRPPHRARELRGRRDRARAPAEPHRARGADPRAPLPLPLSGRRRRDRRRAALRASRACARARCRSSSPTSSGSRRSAETMDPEALSRFLERVFTFAADAIFEQGGTLDKFIGDAVMAFFGAPIPQPDHARRAVAAAARLVEGSHAWNAQRVERGERPVAVRIGHNTGNARRRRHRLRPPRRLHRPRQHGERRCAPGVARRRSERDRRRAPRPRGRRAPRSSSSRSASSAQGPLEGPARVPPEARRRRAGPSPARVTGPISRASSSSPRIPARRARRRVPRPGGRGAARWTFPRSSPSTSARSRAPRRSSPRARWACPSRRGLRPRRRRVAGFPGPFTKWITMGVLGQEGLAKMLDGFSRSRAPRRSRSSPLRGPEDREADVLVAEGRVKGSIALHPRGETASAGTCCSFRKARRARSRRWPTRRRTPSRTVVAIVPIAAGSARPTLAPMRLWPAVVASPGGGNSPAGVVELVSRAATSRYGCRLQCSRGLQRGLPYVVDAPSLRTYARRPAIQRRLRRLSCSIASPARRSSSAPRSRRPRSAVNGLEPLPDQR